MEGLKMRNLHIPTTTPWGPVRLVKLIAPGIFLISAASHAGFYLTPEINDIVSPEIKQMSVEGQGFQGFYEEDEDAAYVRELFLDYDSLYLQ